MKEVLSNALPTLKDPRIGFVTVTGVRTAKGFEHAIRFASCAFTDRRCMRFSFSE